MMVAEFARQAPGRSALPSEGDDFVRLSGRASSSGRSDADRPRLPRSQEVYS
jgi:hypothetical protein